MNKIQLIIQSCTIKQIEILSKFIDSPERSGYAEGKDEGPIVGQLNKLGLIKPKLRTADKIRWNVPDEVVTLENIKFIKGLMK